MLHASCLPARVRQGDPGADLLLRLQPEIGAVLMPRREGRRVRLLDEERAGPYQDVGTYHVLYLVQDARRTDQFVEPGRMSVGVGTPFHISIGDRRSKFPLEPFHVREAVSDLVRRQGRNRKEKSVVAVGR